MKPFLSLVLLAVCAHADAQSLFYIPDLHRPGPAGVELPWEAGVHTGVPGRAKRFRDPGHDDFYPVQFTITSSIPGTSLVAAGTTDGQTTASVASGGTQVTLDSDGSGFAANQGISLGGVIDIDVTGPATGTGPLTLRMHRESIVVTLAQGDSAATVAGKIKVRLEEVLNGIDNFKAVMDEPADIGGGVYRVRCYTDTRCRDGAFAGENAPFHFIPGDNTGNTGVTLTFGFPFEGHYSAIASKAGSVLTLAVPCPTAPLTRVLVSHDDGAAFTAAAAAVTSGNAYLIPAGIYRTETSGPHITASGRVARGAGSGQTIIQCTPYGGQITVSGSSGSIDSAPYIVVAGLEKGSNVITLEAGGGSAYSEGQYVLLKFGNDYSIPVVHMKGNDITAGARGHAAAQTRQQMVKIVGKSGDQLTIEPALAMDYTNSFACITGTFNPSVNSGLEGITQFGQHFNKEHMASMSYADGCWFHDVEIARINNFGLTVSYTRYSEITRLFINRAAVVGSTNHYGLSLAKGATGVLVEDSIFYGVGPLTEHNGGATWCANAYNYYKSSGGAGEDVITNHAAHNNYILYEGENGSYHYSDGYHGSESHQTIFRAYRTGIRLNRLSRHFAMFGNLVGVPNETMLDNGVILGLPQFNDSWSGTSINNDWPDLARALVNHPFTQTGNTITTTTDVFLPTDDKDNDFDLQHVVQLYGDFGNVSLDVGAYIDARNITVGGDPATRSGTLQIWPAPVAGMLERDLQVEATLLRGANYIYYSNLGLDDTEILEGALLPDSLLYPHGTKPQFVIDAEAEFGTTFAWPPVDTMASGGPRGSSPSAIPAGYRFVQNEPPEVLAATINAAGTRVSVTFNKPVRIGSGGSGGWVLSNTLAPTTLTYVEAESSASALVFATSRTILEYNAEKPRIAYTQPGNGVEDAGGTNPDLATFSPISVSNGSTQTGAATVDVKAIEAEATDTDGVSTGNGFYITKVTVPQPMVVNALLVYVSENVFGNSVRGALYDSSLNLLSLGESAAADSLPRWIVMPTEPVEIAPGDYFVGVLGGSGDPVYRYLAGVSPGESREVFQPLGSDPLEFYSPLLARRYAFGIRGFPASEPAPVYTPGRLRVMTRR